MPLRRLRVRGCARHPKAVGTAWLKARAPTPPLFPPPAPKPSCGGQEAVVDGSARVAVTESRSHGHGPRPEAQSSAEHAFGPPAPPANPLNVAAVAVAAVGCREAPPGRAQLNRRPILRTDRNGFRALRPDSLSRLALGMWGPGVFHLGSPAGRGLGWGLSAFSMY